MLQLCLTSVSSTAARSSSRHEGGTPSQTMLGLRQTLRLQHLFPLPNQRPPQRHFQFPPPLNPSPPTRMHPKAAPSKLRLERLNPLRPRRSPLLPRPIRTLEPYLLPHKTLPTLRTPVVQPKDLRLPPTPRAKKQRQPPAVRPLAMPNLNLPPERVSPRAKADDRARRPRNNHPLSPQPGRIHAQQIVLKFAHAGKLPPPNAAATHAADVDCWTSRRCRWGPRRWFRKRWVEGGKTILAGETAVGPSSRRTRGLYQSPQLRTSSPAAERNHFVATALRRGMPVTSTILGDACVSWCFSLRLTRIV